MLFNRRACPCMMGQEPMMMQGQMMPQEDFDGDEYGRAYGFGGSGCGCGCDCGCKMDPIVETPIQKCLKRDICHDVQHVCPVHTKIINNHIYRHTYVPQYSCSEENVVTNIDPGSCCNFM